MVCLMQRNGDDETRVKGGCFTLNIREFSWATIEKGI